MPAMAVLLLAGNAASTLFTYFVLWAHDPRTIELCPHRRGRPQGPLVDLHGDGPELGNGHQSASSHHYEHRIHQPEDRRLDHFYRSRLMA